MPVDTKLNVFSGEEGLKDFYDPDKNIPVPLVELPSRLNPFRQDGVRIYAKLMSHLPATNVKSLPALNMITRAQESGKITKDTHTIIEYSSGSTVISLGIISHILGIPNVKAYVSNKTSQLKLQLLRFFGLDLTLFGGPVQPEHLDPNGGIHVANKDGEKPGVYNPDQYSNIEVNPYSPDQYTSNDILNKNYQAHMRWTGPQIHSQLPDISVFAASIGTAGTMTGTSLYLKKVKPTVTGVGVLTAPNDRVPGPRSLNLLIPVEFPWRESMDFMEEVGSFVSYEKSLELCRNGLLVGPSSGLALVGLLNFLQKQKDLEALDSLRNEDGEIPCVFICCDQPFQYISEYFTKLGPSYFLPITNEELVDTDLYPYNIDWELTPEQATRLLSPCAGDSTESTVVLDFRDEADFQCSHIPGSFNINVGDATRPNLYKDPATLVVLFDMLLVRLGASDPDFGASLEGKLVLLLSEDGNIARLASSILRNRGVRAHYVIDGVIGWKNSGLWPGGIGLEN